MGYWANIFGAGRARDITNATAPSAIASPWAPESNMQRFVIGEALGVELARLPMDRAQAMTVPAVARGRHIIVSAISPLPLRALNADGVVPVQPTWLYRSDTPVSPQERLARTVDSLIFHGHALWAVQRGTKQPDQAHAPILDAAWVPHAQWDVDSKGVIKVDGKPVDAEEVIYFNGLTDGLLNTAARTLRGAVALEDSWVAKAKSPIPLTVIKRTDGQAPLEQDEIDDLLNQWTIARRSEDGALGYLPEGLEIQALGQLDPQFYIEGRNNIRVDIASHLGIPASLLDGSVATASLTYVTTEGNANRFVTETLPLYTQAITNALSSDSVVPRGQRIRFDLTELTTAPGTPTGAVVED